MRRRVYIRGGLTGLAWLALSLVAAGCSPVTRGPARERPALKPGAPRIVVLYSGAQSVVQPVLESMMNAADYDFRLYDVSPERNIHTVADLRKGAPDLLIALGAEAASQAQWLDVAPPTLISLVIQGAVERNRPNTGVVALELPAVTEFTMYRLVLPRLRRILALYSKDASAAFVQTSARELRKQLGIELVAVPVSREDNLVSLYDRHHRDADALWLFNDPVTMTSRAFQSLVKATRRAGQPLLCSSFKEFVYAGALMSVSVDLRNIGAQVAQMAKEVLGGSLDIKTGEVREPIGGRLIVNEDTANGLALEIPRRVRPFISKIVRSDRAVPKSGDPGSSGPGRSVPER